MLTARGIGKTVKSGDRDLVILRDIDLAVMPGEAVAVVGASGSGKSTLLALLAGLDTPSAGSVLLDGADLFALDEDARAELRGRAVGFVFQSFQLLPSLTALENVMLPQMLNGRSRREARARSIELLAMVQLKDRADHRPSRLSGGEQQRVAIARTVANAPRVLLADEPTGNLDAATAESVFQQLLALVRETGMAALVATHNPDLAARMDRVVTLREGVLWS